MDVYLLVLTDGYDSYAPQAVFSSEELAQEAADTFHTGSAEDYFVIVRGQMDVMGSLT